MKKAGRPKKLKSEKRVARVITVSQETSQYLSAISKSKNIGIGRVVDELVSEKKGVEE